MRALQTPSMHIPAMVRRGDLKAVTGLSPATIYRLVKLGQFPQQLQLSPGCVGWLKTDVDTWMETRARGGLEKPALRRKLDQAHA